MIQQINGGVVIENEGRVEYVLNGKAAIGNGPIVSIKPRNKTFEVILTGSGALTATVLLKASLKPDVAGNFFTLKTFTLAGNDRVVDVLVSDTPWHYIQAEVTAITGTSASVDLLVGV